ncbi:MAG: glycosyltransferase, partial [Chitinophagaceae bacterium]
VKVIFDSASDEGIYDAMNKGIDRSSGEWILFLGSDDMLYNSLVLQEMSNKIKTTQAPVIYGNVIIKGDAGWAADGSTYDGFFSLKKLLEKNICHQSVFYHRQVFNRLGKFNTRYKVCADYEFNLRCFAKYEFCYVDLIVATFNGGGTSIVNNDVNFAKDQVYIIFKHFRSQLYRPEFSRYRVFMRSIMFSKEFNTGLFFNITLLYSYTFLTFISYKNKLIHYLTNE